MPGQHLLARPPAEAGEVRLAVERGRVELLGEPVGGDPVGGDRFGVRLLQFDAQRRAELQRGVDLVVQQVAHGPAGAGRARVELLGGQAARQLDVQGGGGAVECQQVHVVPLNLYERSYY
ncbi:hypothetical protein GCM10010185_04730 [Saccharothrix coeruleofusca]|uniref:Uncharacterized protein n=1 Tax=Saccharothrix coeruleofusca TaxID=33919 RepID=A0A918ECK1_9PSEU|nr:hypothetical protein GCM10010185_04730 [Saccharothrix coeruleofusca]